MKKSVISTILALFSLIILGSFYFFYPRNLKIHNVQVFTLPMPIVFNVDTALPIDNKEVKGHWEKKYNISIPTCDYANRFQYISFGKKIASIKYSKISRYFLSYGNVYIGEFEFETEKYSNKIFVYETSPILCKIRD